MTLLVFTPDIDRCWFVDALVRVAELTQLAQGEWKRGFGVVMGRGGQTVGLDEFAVDGKHCAVRFCMQHHRCAFHGESVDLLREAHLDPAAPVLIDFAGDHRLFTAGAKLAVREVLLHAVRRAAYRRVMGFAESVQRTKVTFHAGGGTIWCPIEDVCVAACCAEDESE